MGARGKRSVLFITLVVVIWAALAMGRAARSLFTGAQGRVPAPLSFNEVEGLGIVVKGWVNNRGPYKFAIDTGAGASIISRRVVQEARLPIRLGSRVNISGAGGKGVVVGEEIDSMQLALGSQSNLLPSRGEVIVSPGLPPDLDGVIDPTEVYSPFGYRIDFPNRQLSAFDPLESPLKPTPQREGTIVPWLRDRHSRRPFISIHGLRALIDTGSQLGFAMTPQAARQLGVVMDAGRSKVSGKDLAGGELRTMRVTPVNLEIGTLSLRRIPTDILLNSPADTPILVGLDALRPFEITFDPRSNLIRMEVVPDGI
jgi:hypothetical protein